jgi:hypothetical protein
MSHTLTAFLNSFEELRELDPTVSGYVGFNLGQSVPEHAHGAAVIVPLDLIKRDAKLYKSL